MCIPLASEIALSTSIVSTTCLYVWMNGLSRGAVFGSALVLFSLEGLFIMNVVLLTAGPITLLLLMYSQRIIKATKWIRQRRQEAANGGEVHEPWEIRALQILKCIGKALWRSASFWVALLVSAGLQVALVALYVKINPFVGELTDLLANFLTEISRSSIPIHTWYLSQLCHLRISALFLFSPSHFPKVALPPHLSSGNWRFSCRCTFLPG